MSDSSDIGGTVYDTRNSPHATEAVLKGHKQARANALAWLDRGKQYAAVGEWRMAWRMLRQACLELRATPWKCTEGQ